eukprot:TRINITY_DN16675_c0_g1_i1.p1 TRINITY_DN16675_c0_g1~~TRINITY_DN16675_c0_g1_i1.p1  ORF type:complete len:155 (-),score=35.60 TRINITY_DN16675_c0_g1_i1:80-544(-)
MEPRNIFFQVKRLEAQGLIVKLSQRSNLNTKILYLKKFAPQEKESNGLAPVIVPLSKLKEYNPFDQTYSILHLAKDHTLSKAALRQEYCQYNGKSKKFLAILGKLVDGGYIEEIKPEEPEDGSTINEKDIIIRIIKDVQEEDDEKKRQKRRRKQ